MKVLKIHYVVKNELDELEIKSTRDLTITSIKQVLYFHNDKRKCQSFINKYLKGSKDIYVGLYDQVDNLAWISTLKKFEEDHNHYGVVKMGTYTEVRKYMYEHFGLKN